MQTAKPRKCHRGVGHRRPVIFILVGSQSTHVLHIPHRPAYLMQYLTPRYRPAPVQQHHRRLRCPMIFLLVFGRYPIIMIKSKINAKLRVVRVVCHVAILIPAALVKRRPVGRHGRGRDNWDTAVRCAGIRPNNVCGIHIVKSVRCRVSGTPVCPILLLIRCAVGDRAVVPRLVIVPCVH